MKKTPEGSAKAAEEAQIQTCKTAAKASQTEGKTAANNKRSNTNIWSKVAKAGFFISDPKAAAATAAAEAATKSTPETSVNRKNGSKNNTNSWKSSTQQETPASGSRKNGKNSTKKQQKQYTHFGRSKVARVCFSHNSSEARMRGSSPESQECGGPREERLPVEYWWIPEIFVTIG